MSMGDEHTLPGRNRLVGFLGPVSSSFTLAWLATHRGRLRTMVLGGRRLSVLVIWDRQGSGKVEHSDAEVDAIYQLVYGRAPAKSPTRGRS